MRKQYNGNDPISLLVITNHPEHYSEDEESAQAPQLLSIQSNVPLLPANTPRALFEIHMAANKYGNIPQFFPGQKPRP
jgi:hypothetical protein